MSDEDDGAFRQFMQDAAVMGMSERDIVACFSEWLLINCWRFDGTDFRIFGNFRALDDVTEVVEQGGIRSFQGKMSGANGAMAREKFLQVMDARGFACIHHAVRVDDGPARDFMTLGQYKPDESGAPGLIGVTIECLKPLRQLAVTENLKGKAAE